MTDKSIQDTKLDWLKWLVAVALIAAAVWGNIHFAQEPFLYRVLAIVGVAAIAGYVALQTANGKSFLLLLRGSRVELRKVVWPTRQETLQTTLIVLVVVTIVTLLLWLFDTFFSWLISLLIG